MEWLTLSQTSGSPLWQDRITKLTARTLEYFFPKGIAVETPCELADKIQCTTDQLSFKCYSHRWLSQLTQIAPFTHDTIMPILKTSAAAAAKSCTPDGVCGFRWTTGDYDQNTGAGQEMNALGALLSMLVDEESVAGPYTNATGGTSAGNAGAGSDPESLRPLGPVTERDRAGAGVLTVVVIISALSTMLWMSTGEKEVPPPHKNEKGKSPTLPT